jgi:glycosyltransferase involved in cell wall biosynthesis
MKKLLIPTDGFLPRWDGISSFINEMLPRIENDYDITVIAPNLGELKQKYKANIIRFKTSRIRLADNYYPSKVKPSVMSKEVKKADVVWVQCLGPIGMWGIFFGWFHKKPVVMYNHMLEWEVYPQSQGFSLFKTPVNKISKFLSYIFYNMCKIIIVPSVEHAELLNIMGIKSIKKVVHLGIDVNKYKPPQNREEAKKALGIDPHRFVIGYAGRLSLEKDPKTLYRGFMRYAKKYPESLLMIAGGGHPELEKLFSGKDNIMLTGLKDNLAPYYQAMDIYVLPSLTETTSLTTMEAMATGLPVVVTPVGFIKEYINDGSNGLLFPKQNSFVLSQKLDYLRENKEAREHLGKKARETIVENYSWDKTAEGIKKVLDEA